MGLPNRISIMAQLESGQIFSNGTQYSGTQVLSIEQDLGLATMALGYNLPDSTRAIEAVEILLDDIALNLDPGENRKVILTSETLAMLCLRESVSNVNDYLASSSRQGCPDISIKTVGLATILFQDNQLNYIATNDICCCLFEGGELVSLDALSVKPDPLGASTTLRLEVVSRKYFPGSSLLMLPAKDLEAVGQDFLRLTLSRFNDNMEMALRQIAVRIRRSGSRQDPALILCSAKHA